MRTARAWLGFAAGAALVLAALGWMSLRVAQLTASDAEARESARRDALARAALWRMDSLLAPLIAAENARDPGEGNDVAVANAEVLPVIERFQETGAPAPDPAPSASRPALQDAQQQDAQQEAQQLVQPAAQKQGDYGQRQLFNGNINDNFTYQQVEETPRRRVEPMRPAWRGADLLLVHDVDGERIGSRLDTAAIAVRLRALVVDILPRAEVRPCLDPATAAYPLAALPLQLEPGALPPIGATTSLAATLGLAWVATIVALAAMAILLALSVSLSERRALFVTAVTHELRTPITSLRLYADLLAEGMSADAETRARHLATLRTEAERLGRLVENVLAYARLERAPAAGRSQSWRVDELIARCRDRLERRAVEAGARLEVGLGDAGDAVVVVDAEWVEHILFNLIDNAAKYAGERGGPFALTAWRAGNRLRLTVRDHGPGVPAAVRRRLFRAFARSAQEAAGSAPGVGIGLALSQRLARRMGGDLRLDPGVADGAAFTLDLALAEAPA